MTASKIIKPDHAAKRGHFIFGPEHDAVRKQLRRWVEAEVAPHAPEWEETTFPSEIFRRMGKLGFLGLNKPEEYGGQGGDYYMEMVLAEELARGGSGGFSMGVFVQTEMTLPTILQFGTEEQKQQWAAPAIAGEKILALGITEPDAGSDVAAISTHAAYDPGSDEYVINGSKVFITNGWRADMIVLVTKTDPDAGYEGFTLFLVPMDLPGVTREKKLEKAGMHASDTALLHFKDVRVPASAVLGEVGKGFFQIMWELQGERLIAAAGAVAGAQVLFEKTMEYALQRKAFGREIGHFQVIRHKFAEMSTKIEVGRAMTYMTAWRFQNGEYPVREISQAKLYTSRIACEIADECLQIHGGMGYMRETGIERAWRDLRLNRIGAGTDEVMLDVIGRSFGL
jgi:alkylation response protein AidB-like acyl-CoA dehydrogenase